MHVVYGFVGLKTHAKCVLVVRADDDGLRRYCHIGTGNYNSRTARLYEDVGFLTCDPPVGDDVAQLFNHLTGYSRAHDYYSLLVAPRDLRGQLIDLIEHESTFGSEGRITAKLNSLGDPELVEALYEASAAGVRIDLAVRGICCLRPGVPGLSDNIRVRSILGRYLEHSRIVRFAHGDEGRSALHDRIGRLDATKPRSAHRGAGARLHPKHQAWLDQVFAFQFAEDIVRWEMDGDGSWQRRGPELFTEGDSQERFYHWVADRQKR